MKNVLKLSILSIALLITVSSCKKDADQITAPQVLALTDKVNGNGYKEISEASLKWYFGKAIDPKVNPVLDVTGSLSSTANQPVAGFTILPSNFGGDDTRSLVVPASNYVYVAPFGALMWYYANDACDPTFIPKAGQTDLAFLQESMKSFVDWSKVKSSVKVDGVEFMPDPTKFKVATGLFEMIIDNAFNNPKCDYRGRLAKSYGESYAIMMRLPKGSHKIEMRGEESSSNFVATVTWNLTVE